MKANPALVLPFLLACSDAASDRAGPGAPEVTRPGPIEGSYDFRVSTVTLGDDAFGRPSPSPAGSEGALARVDLRAAAGGAYEAIVTPRGGVASAYEVAFEAGAVALRGGAAAFQGDTWRELTLRLDGAGALDGTAALRGEKEVIEGDYRRTFALEASGSLAPDATAPALAVTATSDVQPPGAFLPWTPLVVRAVEGVDGAALAAAASLVDGAGRPLDSARGPAADATTTAAADWSGARASPALVLTDWDAFAAGAAAGTSAPVVARVAAGVPDRVGLRSEAVETAFPFLRLGPPRPAFSFDQAGEGAHLWGAAVALGGEAPDVRCESGGCVQLGPPEPSGVAVGGAAGRLAGPGRAVRVRYRVFGDRSPKASAGGPPSHAPARALVATVAAPGREPRGAFSPALELFLSTDGAGAALGLGMASAWTDLVVPAPDGDAPPSELGFALRAAPACSVGLCPPYVFAVVVDAIEAQ